MNPLRRVAIHLGARPWLPRYARVIVGVDRAIQKLTRGRLTLLTASGLPELMLTVVGRKTGVPHTTPLLCVPHDGGWLVAGSNWGNPDPPAWVHNLRAADGASVRFRGIDSAVSVRIAAGAEREALWRVLVATWPNYDLYAERIEREIPVFVLMPK
ncbi:nitroreductase family deazaflavin-dependent oxidoreductase [Rhodococcus artemisiae]|uniref:Nitroreductase family deazaflavin-dependent oxidoreductase n=1 Tax=Rhodococcus artemisiae TaxID=714159 RepID=A0ABU7L665_9NOCA|nr:nitroreductase family deazaflavin-dependent oxidoreductase [Rhodococcus artemisiae]MEE2057003.1 nitroreductase family deazaflavin-dependent oxidoreductase [Rhodococcus artemisiae]